MVSFEFSLFRRETDPHSFLSSLKIRCITFFGFRRRVVMRMMKKRIQHQVYHHYCSTMYATVIATIALLSTAAAFAPAGRMTRSKYVFLQHVDDDPS